MLSDCRMPSDARGIRQIARCRKDKVRRIVATAFARARFMLAICRRIKDCRFDILPIHSWEIRSPIKAATLARIQAN